MSCSGQVAVTCEGCTMRHNVKQNIRFSIDDARGASDHSIIGLCSAAQLLKIAVVWDTLPAITMLRHWAREHA